MACHGGCDRRSDRRVFGRGRRALGLVSIRLLSAALVLSGALLRPGPATAQEVPTPEAHFGFVPGADRELAGWDELAAYYERLADGSPRVALDTLGSTTRGRSLVMLTVTSEENHARLEELREVQARLSDPRRISDASELEELLDEGRAVVLVTHGVHSSEVGSVMVAPRFLHRLATSSDPRVAEILENVVVLDIPSLNPDGTQWTAEWYRRWVGTEYEASPLPWLYHHYVGHDNNRDWYAFTQLETEHVVRGAHQKWHPHIVHDIHQMGRDGPRIFLPPYVGPWEPNVDPALTGAVNDLGTWAAASLLREGKSGVVVNAIYDAYSPARAYSHYHAGARILSETASARLASPDSVFPWELRSGRGYDPRERSWNHPDPWEGGRWGLPEITDYMESGAMAVLLHAARNRRHWLELAHGISQRAVEGWGEWPAAWVIPTAEGAEPGFSHLLRILRLGEVEVRRTGRAMDVGGRTFEEGAWVIPMEQPYAGFAQTLLEAQEYPDLRQDPDEPPVRPYDVTAHTLPLLTGVEAIPVDSLPSAELGPVVPEPERTFELPAELAGPDAPRIALYKSNQEPMVAGWTRWLFDRHGLVYDTLGTDEIREGGLRETHDVIVLQSQSYGSMVNGWSVGEVPPDWSGGLGVEGSRALRDFVRNGGRLVAMEQATDFVVRILGLDVANAVERLPAEEFFVPGSLVRVTVESDPDSTDGTGGDLEAGNAASVDREVAPPAYPTGESAVWFGPDSRAFTVTDPTVRILARYSEVEPLLSGWMVGPDHVTGRPALLEADAGRGSVVLFGFQPNYRGQSVATWPLLFDALIPEATGETAGGDP